MKMSTWNEWSYSLTSLTIHVTKKFQNNLLTQSFFFRGNKEFFEAIAIIKKHHELFSYSQ